MTAPPSTPEPSDTRVSRWLTNSLPVLVIVVAAVAGLLVQAQRGVFSSDFQDLDVQADWIVARATVDGLSPYTGLEELGERYAVPYRFNRPEGQTGDAAHPRTPGAVLLSLPLAALSYDQLNLAALVVGAGALVLAIVLTMRDEKAAILVIALAVLIVLSSRSASWSFRWTNQSTILALCSWFVLRARHRESTGAGLALAVAGALKLFPLLLLLPLIRMRRWRTVGTAIAASAALQLIPLAVPHIRLGDAITALQEAREFWYGLGGNISLAAALDDFGFVSSGTATVIALLGIGALVALLWARDLSADVQLLVAAAASVILVPVGWESYLLFMVPFLLAVLLRTTGAARWVWSIGLIVLAVPPTRPAAYGTMVALVAAAMAVHTAMRSAPHEMSPAG